MQSLPRRPHYAKVCVCSRQGDGCQPGTTMSVFLIGGCARNRSSQQRSSAPPTSPEILRLKRTVEPPQSAANNPTHFPAGTSGSDRRGVYAKHLPDANKIAPASTADNARASSAPADSQMNPNPSGRSLSSRIRLRIDPNRQIVVSNGAIPLADSGNRPNITRHRRTGAQSQGMEHNGSCGFS
jgi:hypothetical protein